MFTRILLTSCALAIAAAAAHAQDISTHVLDLARGVGGAGIPVRLDRWEGADWQEVATAVTAESGRVEAFVPGADSTDQSPAGAAAEPQTYRLTFDLDGYRPDSAAAPDFFPEAVVTFRIADPAVHTHVPLVLSPYGYSTYKGG